MTLSAELVSKWIDAFPITVNESNCVDYIYSAYIIHQANLHRNSTWRS